LVERPILSRPPGRSVREVAGELGVSYESLGLWLKQEQLNRAERDDGLTSNERGELRRLRRQLPEERFIECLTPRSPEARRRRLPVQDGSSTFNARAAVQPKRPRADPARRRRTEPSVRQQPRPSRAPRVGVETRGSAGRIVVPPALDEAATRLLFPEGRRPMVDR
jgi:transposase-like protein